MYIEVYRHKCYGGEYWFHLQDMAVFGCACRWRQYAPSNLWYLYSFTHGVISQKTKIFMKTFRVNKGIAAVILNLDTRHKGAVNLTPRSVYLRDRTGYTVNRRLVDPQSLSTRRLREHKYLWTYLNSNLGPSSVNRSRYINSRYEGWNFNSGNYLFTTNTK